MTEEKAKDISREPLETQKIVEDTVATATQNINSVTEQLFQYIGLEQLFGSNNQWLQALVLLALVVVLAYGIKLILKLVQRRVTSKTRTQLDNQIIGVLLNPMTYSVMLLGGMAVATTLPLSLSMEDVVHQIILSIFWLIWGVAIYRIIKLVLHAIAYRGQGSMVTPQTLPLFSNLSLVVTFSILLYVVLSTWGVDMTAWVASAGVLGIALGFAAKDTLSNLFSGVFILADQPYKMGDYVVLNSGERGEITHIGIRSTRMLTRDDVEVTVPNAIMGNTKIINESGGPYKKFRIRVEVGVAYGTDVNLVRNILCDVATHNEDVCKDPEPRVRFRVFGASSLDFELLCWVLDPALRGKVLDQLNEEVYQAFIAAGVEIPYQKQDLYIKELPRT